MKLPEGFLWVVLTVYLEAQNQPDLGQKQVTKVILNRADAKGWPLKDITLARKQFSVWNNGIETPKTWIRGIITFVKVSKNCEEAYMEWVMGDTLGGATHYYSPKSMIPRNSVPYWVPSMKFITQTKDHKFYKEG